MDAKIVDLQILFQQPISYQIPQFQRSYAWGEESQWEPLWEDVRTVAEHYLNGEMGDKIRPHFMGAIVLFPQTNKTGEVTKSIIVDGQQRLTTLQLLIKAAQQLFQSQDDMARADRLRELTTNPESYCIVSDDETKIRQSNRNDQKAFQAAIVDDYSDNSRQSIAEAYKFFKKKVNKWLNSEPENRAARADALEDTLAKHLQIAVIDLDKDEQPHLIFETLNARSERLKESDLIKNTVMYEADVIDDAQKARELWGMFDDEWWESDTGKTSGTQIDRFLNYWMVMRILKEVNAGRVASEFRNYIEDREDSIETVTEEIRQAGIIYKDMEKVRTPRIEIFLKRMKIMNLGVITPLLLWLQTSNVPPEHWRGSIEVLESYLVRRMLCGYPTAGLNRFFISLLNKLNDVGPAYADRTIIEYLSSQTADNQIWPADWRLREALIGPMKGRGMIARRKMVLEAIEMNLRSEKSEPLGATDRLTVEHIMPEKWEKNWPLTADVSDEVEAERIRNEAIATIGNLTLTTSKLNIALSNSPWSVKRRELGNHSTLFLNKQLLNGAPNVWNEATIRRRSHDLAKSTHADMAIC